MSDDPRSDARERDGDDAARAAAPPSRARRAWRIARVPLVALAVLLVAAVAFTAWVVATPSGTAWAVNTVATRVPGVQVAGAQGTVAERLTLHGVRYRPPRGGTEVYLRRVVVALDLAALLRGTVHVSDARILDVAVLLGEAPPEEDEKPFSLDPPIDVVVERFLASDLVVYGMPEATEEAAAPRRPILADVRSAEARGRWTSAGLALERLDLRAREGAVQLTARAASRPAGASPDSSSGASPDGTLYDARADGTFRWRAGAQEYAGTLVVRTEGERSHAQVRLTAPIRAQVAADVRQVAGYPWSARVNVPAFDPRDSVMPGSSIESLAAELAGRGTATTAELAGNTTIDGEVVHLETLRVRREAEDVVLDPLVVRLGDSPGRLRVTGRVALGADPVSGRVDARWSDLTIPERLAGQRLRTRGRASASGSAEAYVASGRLALGPVGRLANLELDVRGAPDRVQLERFDVVQASGRLAASGVVELRPRTGWQLDARARSFDPGEFLAGWPGDLRFTLRTRGTLAEEGPRGNLQLDDLRGRLRGRPLQGNGDLEFAAPGRLAGELQLRSGDSRVRIVAAEGDALDATANFRVASLDDFVPGAAGAVDGRVRARGTWPALVVDGRVGGRGLRVATASVDAFEATFDVREPRTPSGSARLRADAIEVAGLAFERATFEAQGDRGRHAATLEASGTPLAVRTRVTGSLDAKNRWQGAVEQLALDLEDAAALRLEAPMRIAYGAGALQVARSCLADGDVRLCADANLQPDGRLEASYDLAAVPLGLANVVLADALPGRLRGTVGGSGRVRRDAAGLWYGDAARASPEAAIAWTGDAPAAALAGEELLLYRDLRANAQLRGNAGDARLSAAVGGEGSLDGEVALSGLDAASPAVRAKLAARLPTLAPFAPFVPQVDALDGEVRADATVGGTLAAPRIDANVRAERLRAEVPAVGLRLQDGAVRVVAAEDGTMRLDGSVRSGDGALTLQGTVGEGGRVQATLTGENFLVADLPAARVIAAPDLRIDRNAERVRVSGTVTIPSASIDVQKLPQAGPQVKARSPDVVVVNEPVEEVAPEKAVPLYASVDVILGDDVELAGFGLESTLAGRLTVREAPGRPPTGSGEVRVEGTYRAYGQDLTITEGRVLYAGTALDDPRLDITAVREVDEITAGLRITGRARSPDVRVFSDPALGQTDALAYLVAGRPLSSVGRGGDESDGDMLQQASQRLGTAAGGLLAKRLGARLGVDEVGIAESEEIGGAAFTVGEYLSPRLYLGFGVGLFDPGQVVTIRYALSEALSIEAVRGDETTRAGVEYRVER